MNLSIICMPKMDTFIRPLAERLSNEYEIRLTLGVDENEILNEMQRADVVWLEWANDSAVVATKQLTRMFKRPKIILRLHSYEALGGYLPLITWGVVDKLVLVAPHMADVCEWMMPGITQKVDTVILPNGVDLDEHPLKERDHGENVAWVCDISHKKGPELFAQVVSVNRDKKFHVAGGFQEPRYILYLQHILKEMDVNVIFYGHLDSNMMNAFWENQNYLISTSPHEGHPYNIMEAMARGIKPLIHNFYGADKLYPKHLLWNTLRELRHEAEFRSNYDSMKYREHVVMSNWTLDAQVDGARRIIES